MSSDVLLREKMQKRFKEAGIELLQIEIKSFPGEVIVIAHVLSQYERALELAHELDGEIEGGFVTVRRVASDHAQVQTESVPGVHDERVDRFVELLNSRARTSESQPSLRYIPDVSERIGVAMSPRHHLIFGRRGVGKTALLLEAKKRLANSAHTLWVNVQPLRSLEKDQAFLTIAGRICDLALGAIDDSENHRLFSPLRDEITEQQTRPAGDSAKIAIVVPRLQHALSRFALASNCPLYVFLDDIHYLKPSEVPGLLDLLHGITRDNPVWLKVAGIRHQTRWFTPVPPTGLQTGHDAEIINLDITLEEPARAKQFLQNILSAYAEESGIKSVRNFLGDSAIDRLVLASGGVPRDFLSLCASAVQIAKRRSNARTVGVQDVNNAAGAAAKVKLQELEDDAAAARGGSENLVAALNTVRNFLLSDRQITFLRIDFLDKEHHADEYALMQALMDLRMLHLVNASLSDPHHAGSRSEVFMLDLSQYSGARLKQRLRVLEFEKDHLVLKRTRHEERPMVGDTPRRLVELLRRGPLFELALLKNNG